MQNYDNRRPKSRKNIQKKRFEKGVPGIRILISVFLIGIMIAAVVFLLMSSIEKGKRANAGQNGIVETEETQKPKTERVMSIDGIPVTGLSLKEAEKKLPETRQWDIKLTYKDSVETLKNPLSENLDDFLKEIYSQDESLWQEN